MSTESFSLTLLMMASSMMMVIICASSSPSSSSSIGEDIEQQQPQLAGQQCAPSDIQCNEVSNPSTMMMTQRSNPSSIQLVEPSIFSMPSSLSLSQNPASALLVPTTNIGSNNFGDGEQQSQQQSSMRIQEPIDLDWLMNRIPQQPHQTSFLLSGSSPITAPKLIRAFIVSNGKGDGSSSISSSLSSSQSVDRRVARTPLLNMANRFGKRDKLRMSNRFGR